MEKWNVLVSCCVLLNCFTSVQSILSWHQRNATADELEVKYIKNEHANPNYTDHYTELVSKFHNLTMDQKCERGLPIGIGFQWYNPYVNLGFTPSYNTLLSGIFPEVTRNMMRKCCPHSDTTYGRHFVSIEEIENNAQEEGDIDIYFPLYAIHGKSSTDYKGYHFIPIVTAPRIVVLVPERLFQELNPRMSPLLHTIVSAWPMLVFTVVSTMLAGLVVWFLDHKKNAAEFPPTFYQGAWEGIWWAFVTMTTVGYGDRSPKSPYARAFCIMWILVGIILISLFTGLITSALSASATPVFNLAGSAIGAVNGSVEYQVGVGFNADMRAFDHHPDMFHTMIVEKTLHAVMVDNFILSANADHLKEKIKVRMEREIEAPITYGMVLGDTSSPKMYSCFKKYADHNRHKIFEIVSNNLRPISNPTDQVRLEVAASDTLFYEDSLFKTIVFSEVGVLIAFFIFGFLSEKWAKEKIPGLYHKLRKTTKEEYCRNKDEECSMNEIKEDDGLFSNNDLQGLINEYDEYHLKWSQRVRSISNKTPLPIIARSKGLVGSR